MTESASAGLTYEAEELAYYAEYGRAVAAWAIVEAALSRVAQIFFQEGTERAMLGSGLTGIQDFHSRLQFVDLAVTRGIAAITIANRQGGQVGDGKTIYGSRWKELAERLAAISVKRNHLARYVTVHFPDNPREGRRIALCPWHGSRRMPKDMPPSGSYTVKKLIEARREFERVKDDLANFALLLGNRITRLPQVNPPGEVPTTQQIADQMHAALGHQQESAEAKKQREEERNAAASLEIPIEPPPTEVTNDGKPTGS